MTTLFRHSVRTDIVILYLAETIICFLAFHATIQYSISIFPENRSTELGLSAALAGCAGLAFGISGLYQPDNWLRSRRLLIGSATAAVLLLLIFHFGFPILSSMPEGGVSWYRNLAIVAGFAAAVIMTRLVLVAVSRGGMLRRRVVLVGIPDEILGTPHWLHQDLFVDIVLILPADPGLAYALSPVRLAALNAWAVIVKRPDEVPAGVQTSLAASGVRFYTEAEFLERRFRRVDLSRLASDWQTGAAGAETRVEAVLRRAFDIVLSLTLVLFTLPLLLLTALAIRLDSPGDIFYRQDRVGRDGRVFSLLKFRSMGVDAEAGGTARWATKQDPRVTRVGRILRMTRIDEIPQVLNVLRGDMAFVGPRPERPVFVNQLAEVIPHYNQRSRVKPGITGWAQVSYPYGASVDDARMKLAYDFYYIERRSLFLDLLILIATVRVVLFQEGSR